MKHRALIGIWLLLAQLPAMTAHSAPLTLADAVERTRNNSPAAAAARFERDALLAERELATFGPAPEVGLEVENFLGSGDFDALDASETTLSVSRVFERGDKAALRETAAGQRLTIAEARLAMLERELVADVEHRFYVALAAQVAVDNATDAMTQAERTEQLVQRRVAAGRSSDAELSFASVRVGQAQVELKRSHQQANAARNRLARAWGAPDADFDAVAGQLLRPFAAPELEQLLIALDASPALSEARADSDLKRAEQRLTQARASNDVELSGGLRYFADEEDTAFVVGFSMPFATGSRSAAANRAADSRAAAAPLASAQRRRDLQDEVTDLHSELNWRLDAIRALQTDMIPLAEQAIEQYRQGFERGAHDLIELTEAESLALDLEQQLTRTAAEAHALRIELIRLSGAPAGDPS